MKTTRENTKLKYLLDECVTIHWPYNTGEIHDYVNSVDLIGHGANDDKVFELALKLNRILVTSDMKFTLKVLLDNHSVCFQKMNGERYFIKPQAEKIADVGKCDDYITQFLLKSEEIIIP